MCCASDVRFLWETPRRVTYAWSIMLVANQLPWRGQSSFTLQLHVFSCGFLGSALHKIDLLCAVIIYFTLGMKQLLKLDSVSVYYFVQFVPRGKTSI